MSGPPDNKMILGGKRIATLPDGTILEFDKNTPRDVQERVYQTKLNEWMTAEAARRQKEASTPKVGGPEAFGIGTTQGILANFGDEAASAIGATIGRPGGEALPGETWGERYDNALEISRARQGAAREQHPYAYGTGQVTGAVGTAVAAPALTGAKYIAAAPSMAGMMGRSGLVGGIYGSVGGFGEGEGGFTERATSAALGAAGGAVVGAAIPPIAKAAGAAVKGIKNWAVDKLWPSVTITEAPRVAPMGVGDAAEAVAPRASTEVKPSNINKASAKIADALRRDGYTTEQVAAILNALGPRGMLADVGENTKTLLTSAMGAPGAGKQIGKTALENRQLLEQPTLESAAQRAMGTRGNIYSSQDSIISQRQLNARPAYDEFYNSDPEQYSTEFMRRLLDSPTGQDLLGRARQIYELERLQGRAPGNLFEPLLDAEGNLTLNTAPQPRVLDYVKQAIDSHVQEYIDPLTGRIRGPVGNAWDGLRREFLSDIDSTNPLYARARDAYSGPSQSLEAIENGRRFIGADSEEIARQIADLQMGDIELFRQGALRALVDRIKSKPADISVVQQLRSTGLLERVRQLVPDNREFNAFVQELNNARRFNNTKNAATSGSQTTEKLLGAMDLANSPVVQAGQDVMTGNKAGLLSRGLNWLGQLTGPGEETRAAIVRALTSNNRNEIDETLRRAMLAQQLMNAQNQAIGAGAAGGASTAALYGDALLGRKGGPR